MAVFTGDALWVKLHAVYLIFSVRNALNYPVIARCCDFKGCRHTFGGNSQRMVSRREEVVVESAKNAFSGVVNPRKLAMHGFGCSDDPSAINLGDRLMAKTNSEDRVATVSKPHKIKTDTCFIRCARAGGEHNGLWLQGASLGRRQLIVSPDDDLRAQLSQIMEQVVGEAVVV